MYNREVTEESQKELISKFIEHMIPTLEEVTEKTVNKAWSDYLEFQYSIHNVSYDDYYYLLPLRFIDNRKKIDGHGKIGE